MSEVTPQTIDDNSMDTETEIIIRGLQSKDGSGSLIVTRVAIRGKPSENSCNNKEIIIQLAVRVSP